MFEGAELKVSPAPLQMGRRMAELARATDALRHAIPSGARIGYVDYPMHLNIGDLLIYLGAMDFLRCNGNEIGVSFCVFDANRANVNALEDCDVIVCHGGGNFGDIYPQHQELRERIIRTFRRKPIVIMPQSFHFGSREAMRNSARVFRSHQALTIAVRDRHSLELAQENFSSRVMLLPDMAHRLYDRFAPIRKDIVAGAPTLYLLRRDIEQVRSGANEVGVDWADLLSLSDKLGVGRHRLASILAGRLNWRTPRLMGRHHRTTAQIVEALARRVVPSPHWVTSRLHGAIFGLLLDRKVTLRDNSYGKNSRYFAQWGEGIPNLSEVPEC